MLVKWFKETKSTFKFKNERQAKKLPEIEITKTEIVSYFTIVQNWRDL